MIYSILQYSKLEYIFVKERELFYMAKMGKNKRILIVDDDVTIRDILGLVLTEQNFIVEKAGNGKEALEKVDINKPDLIVLDGIMPVMDGFETYSRLKSNPETQNIPIIFCTATPIEEVIQRQIKADDYIEKPCTLKTFCEKIYKMLT